MKAKSLIATFTGAALGTAGGIAFAVMGGSSLFLLGTVGLTIAAIVGGSTALGAVVDMGRAAVSGSKAKKAAKKAEAADTITFSF